MSNEEKLKRAKHERFRKTWIAIQVFFILVVVCMLAGASFLYFKTDDAIDVEYNQTSEIDYTVFVDNADGFYGSDPVVSFGKTGSVDTFVVSRINKIVFDFDYKAEMDTQNAQYEYKYWVDAKYTITDTSWKGSLLDETKVLLPEVTGTQNSSNVLTLDSGLVEVSLVEYVEKYNQYASVFELDRAEATLVVSLHVNVASDCDATDVNNSEYVAYVTVPLSGQTTKLSYSNPPSSGVISGCNTASSYKQMAELFLYTLIPGLIVLLLILFLFVKFTVTPNVDYANRVKKIVRNYSSYIQQIKKQFNVVGYHIVELVSFTELLEIRDTIQQPILMHENEDRTCTNFIIPTESKIMYVYQVAVEGYEEPIEQILAEKQAEQQVIIKEVIREVVKEETPVEEVKEESVQEETPAEELVEETSTEEPVVEEEIVEETAHEQPEEIIEETPAEEVLTEEPVVEELVEETSTEEPVEEEVLEEIVEETQSEEVVVEELVEEQPEEVLEPMAVVAPVIVEETVEEPQVISEETPDDRLNYSFEAKLILADEKTQGFYKDIVSFARSYGVKVVRSFKRERIYLGRELFAILVFKGKSLCACLPLDPSAYTDSHYKYKDMSAYKKYEEAPFLMKLTSGLKVRHVNELLEALFLNAGVENQNKETEEIIIPVKSKQELFEEGQIKFKNSILSSKKKVVKEEVIEETIEEEPIVEEVLEELVEEALEEVTEETTATGSAEAKLNYSFEAKLILADEKTKGFYKDIVSFAKAYGVKVVRSFKRERIYLGKELFAILVFKGKSLCACLPLDPSAYTDSHYKYKDMSAYKKYEEAPFLMKLTSGLKVRHVNELLEALFLNANVENQNLEVEEIEIPTKTKDELVSEGLIKDKTTII